MHGSVARDRVSAHGGGRPRSLPRLAPASSRQALWRNRETYEQVVAHYLPCIEGREPTDHYLILVDGRDVTACAATVEEDDRRSWRAFEKAGFTHVRDVEEDGLRHRLMRLERTATVRE